MIKTSSIPAMVVYDGTVFVSNSVAISQGYPPPSHPVLEMLPAEYEKYYFSRTGKSGILTQSHTDYPGLLFFDTVTDTLGSPAQIFFGETEKCPEAITEGATPFDEVCRDGRVSLSRETLSYIFKRYLTVCSCLLNPRHSSENDSYNINIYETVRFIKDAYLSRTDCSDLPFDVKISPSVSINLDILVPASVFCALNLSAISFLADISGSPGIKPNIHLLLSQSDGCLNIKISANTDYVTVSSLPCSDIISLARLLPAQLPHLAVLSRIVASNGFEASYRGTDEKFFISFSMKSFVSPAEISAPALSQDELQQLNIVADFLL